MNRLVLINRKKSPSREELSTTERAIGEKMLHLYPSARWAGYIIVEGLGKRAAAWIIPNDIMDEVKEFVKTISTEDYEIALFEDGKTLSGGMTEVRII